MYSLANHSVLFDIVRSMYEGSKTGRYQENFGSITHQTAPSAALQTTRPNIDFTQFAEFFEFERESALPRTALISVLFDSTDLASAVSQFTNWWINCIFKKSAFAVTELIINYGSLRICWYYPKMNTRTGVFLIRLLLNQRSGQQSWYKDDSCDSNQEF